MISMSVYNIVDNELHTVELVEDDPPTKAISQDGAPARVGDSEEAQQELVREESGTDIRVGADARPSLSEQEVCESVAGRRRTRRRAVASKISADTKQPVLGRAVQPSAGAADMSRKRQRRRPQIFVPGNPVQPSSPKKQKQTIPSSGDTIPRKQKGNRKGKTLVSMPRLDQGTVIQFKQGNGVGAVKTTALYTVRNGSRKLVHANGQVEKLLGDDSNSLSSSPFTVVQVGLLYQCVLDSKYQQNDCKQRPLSSLKKIKVGTIVYAKFPDNCWYRGIVTRSSQNPSWYNIVYEDGDFVSI